MEMVNVAIVCKDKEYAGALAWAIVRNTRGMEVQTACDFDSLEQSGTWPDIVLAESGWFTERSAEELLFCGRQTSRLFAPVVIYLTERKADEDVSSRRLFKYKNIRQMTNELYDIYDEIKGVSTVRDTGNRKDAFCFIAERGGSGCSCICNAFADELAEAGNRKVLKISLDQFPDQAENDNSPSNIKKYLYYILERKADDGKMPDGWDKTALREAKQNSSCNISLRPFVTGDAAGADSFRQAAGPNPLLTLDEKEFIVFMKSIMNSSEYDTIVIDCGSQVTMQMIKVIELCKRVFFVKDGRPEKTGFRDCMAHIIEDKDIKKMIPVYNSGGRTGLRTATQLCCQNWYVNG